MNELHQILICAFAALFCTCWIHPYALKIAKTKNIVDNPNARKLQRTPIPVMGGLTVVFGMLSGLMAYDLFENFYGLFPICTAVIIIMIVGLIDDIISLSPRIRLVIEITLVLFLIYSTDCQINNLGGLWTLSIIPDYLSVPLTVFACVGIINAINLIDGVDGYSSGYSIVSCILFGAMFCILGNMRMVALAAVVAASLLPFFFYNVFGKRSKMFIGDAGTLSLGIIFSVFVMTILSANQSVESLPDNLGLVPFSLAVLCVPVFDTLRVMSMRIVRGKSPFCPDKTHLHHMFIELGYSHIGTTLSIIGINLVVVLCWFLAFRCGLAIDAQLYIVLSLGVSVTFILYQFVKAQINRHSKIYRGLRKLAMFTHAERKGFWLAAQKWVDKSAGEGAGEPK